MCESKREIRCLGCSARAVGPGAQHLPGHGEVPRCHFTRRPPPNRLGLTGTRMPSGHGCRRVGSGVRDADCAELGSHCWGSAAARNEREGWGGTLPEHTPCLGYRCFACATTAWVRSAQTKNRHVTAARCPALRSKPARNSAFGWEELSAHVAFMQYICYTSRVSVVY